MKERLLENLKEIKERIKYYEEKTYTIQNISLMVNDRIEYDRLIGEKRSVEIMLMALDIESKRGVC